MRSSSEGSSTCRFLAESRDSRPVFLIELDVRDEELSDLFRHISQIGTSVQTRKENPVDYALPEIPL